MDNIQIDFAMKVGVNHIKVETKEPFRLRLIDGAVDSDGNPVDAYHKTKGYEIVATITIGEKKYIFSDLYEEFSKAQKNKPWKHIGLSFGGYSIGDIPGFNFTGTVYSMNQWTDVYNFIQEFMDAHS